MLTCAWLQGLNAVMHDFTKYYKPVAVQNGH